MTKVTAILISKNVEPYIRECLDSVCNQTLSDIEILCVDAFSNDGTREIIEEFQKKDSRVRLLDDVKGSTGYSNNYGMKEAQGEYLAFIETDDYIDLSMFEVLYDIAKENDCDYVKSDYYAFWTTDDGERIFRKRNTFENEELYNKVIEPRKYIDVATGDWYLWKGLYKKSFLMENNILFSETKGAAFQDIGFLHQTTSKALRAMYLSSYHYCYCIDREGSSSNSTKMMRYAWQEYKRLLSMKAEDDEILNMLYARMAKSFVCCYRGSEDPESEVKNDDEMDYMSWFKKELRSAIQEGYLYQRNIPTGLWIKMLRFLDMTPADSINKESLIHFLQRKTDSDIAIFGCGGYGYEVYRWLKRSGFTIRVFFDNDSSLWGKSANGIKIDDPDCIVDYPAEMRIIIANEVYYDDIKSQLMGKGVDEERIYIYG